MAFSILSSLIVCFLVVSCVTDGTTQATDTQDQGQATGSQTVDARGSSEGTAGSAGVQAADATDDTGARKAYDDERTTAAGPYKQPHIVFVLVDDLGYNDIGYRNKDINTTTIDKLARSGVILEDYYVQPICTPTRSQLLTGNYQIHTGLQHRVIDNMQRMAIPEKFPTIADKLNEVGYSTHMVGKWHVGYYMEKYCPWKRGFHTFFGMMNGLADHYTHLLYDAYDLMNEKQEVFRNESGHYSTELFTQKAIDVIHSTAKSGKPMFLYLAYQAVHDPFKAPDRLKKQYDFIKHHTRKTYSAMVSSVDEGVKNLTDALKETGMWKDTIFVFSSDNGGPWKAGSNYPLRGDKWTLWEGGIRSVAFVAGGRVKASGVRNRELIHVSDWFPTLVKQGGGKIHEDMQLDGVDQWAAITDGQPSGRDTILHNIDKIWRAENKKDMVKGWNTDIRAAIRYKDMKLLTGAPGNGVWTKPPSGKEKTFSVTEPESTLGAGGKHLWLFNITADPKEENDLSGSSEYDSIKEVLLTKLINFQKTTVKPQWTSLDKEGKPQNRGVDYWGPWRCEPGPSATSDKPVLCKAEQT